MSDDRKLTTVKGVNAYWNSDMSDEAWEAALLIDQAENERLDALDDAEAKRVEHRDDRLRLDVAERRLRVNDRMRRLRRRPDHDGGAE